MKLNLKLQLEKLSNLFTKSEKSSHNLKLIALNEKT